MNSREYPLILLLLAFIVSFGFIFHDSYLISIMIAIGLLVMNLIGLDLIYGYCGQVDFGHQAFYALGAYFTAILVVRLGISPLVAITGGALLSSFVAFLIGKILFRLRGYYFILATMIFGLITYYAFGALPEWTGGMTGMPVPYLSLGNWVVDSEIGYYWVVWILVIIMLVIALNIVRGRTGRALKAISASEIAAETLGIDITKYLIEIYVLGAAFASIAGSLLAHHERFVVPYYFGVGAMVMMFVALCLGGKGTIWGSLLGGTVLTILPEFMYVFKTYSTLFYGVVFVLTLTLLPDGLAGLLKSGVSVLSGKFKLRIS
jgi:branched-chain amino acid transport system permease protein